jgi:hypothetical protein
MDQDLDFPVQATKLGRPISIAQLGLLQMGSLPHPLDHALQLTGLGSTALTLAGRSSPCA